MSAFGEINHRHPTATKFPLDRVAIGEGGFQVSELIRHIKEKMHPGRGGRESADWLPKRRVQNQEVVRRSALCPTQISGETVPPEERFIDSNEIEYRDRLARALGDDYELRDVIGRGGFGTRSSPRRRAPNQRPLKFPRA